MPGSADTSVVQTPLSRAAEPLTATVLPDQVTLEALKPFDLSPDAPISFHPWRVPSLPDTYGIGLIVGASGSGKSLLLAEFGTEEPIEWADDRSIASHFDSSETVADRFYAVGLNSVPVWRLPYQVLSNGQRFRADLARRIKSGAVVDEFTSVVDRNVAVAASKSLRGWVDREGVTGMVLATCHRDVVPWLRPDWVIDTDAGTLTVGAAERAPHWYAEHVQPEGEVGRLVLH